MEVLIAGICLGMQLAVVEFARNVLGWKDADSAEFNEEAGTKIVVFMPEISKTHMGRCMGVTSKVGQCASGGVKRS